MFAVIVLLLATTIKTYAHTLAYANQNTHLLFEEGERQRDDVLTVRTYIHISYTIAHSHTHSQAQTNEICAVHKIEYAMRYLFFILSITLLGKHSINMTLTPTIQSHIQIRTHTHTYVYLCAFVMMCACFSAAPPTRKLQYSPPCCRTCH